MKLCILLLFVVAANALDIHGNSTVLVLQGFEPFEAHFEGQLLQDYIHMDVQDPATEQRVAGPLTWLQLLPGLTPKSTDTLVISPKVLALDKFGWQYRYHSFVLGYRLFGAPAGANNATTEFFRFRVNLPPAEDLTGVYVVLGVVVGIAAVLFVAVFMLSFQES